MSEKTKVFPIPVTFEFKVVTIDGNLKKVFLGNKEIELPGEVINQPIDLEKMADDIANPHKPQPKDEKRPEHPPIYASCIPFKKPDGTIYYYYCIPGGNKSC